MLKDEPKADEPIHLGDRAIDNLKFIRETMERSTHFTAVPGYGGILMGVTAVATAFIANAQATFRDSLVAWLIEAFLAFAIGLLAMWQKSKIGGQSLLSVPARKFAMSFAPPLIAGVATVLGVWRYGDYFAMPAICMLSYGAAVVCGGAFSARVVPVMGWCFVVLGVATFLLPANYGNTMMGVSFGGLHIIFGAIIARKYGG
ncbi:MAG TPA: hypothetical protein VHQ01_02430 [Pyrinomonadaceae bacterium]|nr:hypothetical protein [Pyrinomonadaceae bacterium]